MKKTNWFAGVFFVLFSLFLCNQSVLAQSSTPVSGSAGALSVIFGDHVYVSKSEGVLVYEVKPNGVLNQTQKLVPINFDPQADSLGLLVCNGSTLVVSLKSKNGGLKLIVFGFNEEQDVWLQKNVLNVLLPDPVLGASYIVSSLVFSNSPTSTALVVGVSSNGHEDAATRIVFPSMITFTQSFVINGPNAYLNANIAVRGGDDAAEITIEELSTETTTETSTEDTITTTEEDTTTEETTDTECATDTDTEESMCPEETTDIEVSTDTDTYYCATEGSLCDKLEKAADYATKNAIGKGSDRCFGKGKCARYVRQALANKDSCITLAVTEHAKDYGPSLIAAGLVEVIAKPYTPQKGDIVIIQACCGHTSGHMAIYNGTNWVSDFVQDGYSNGIMPGQSWKNCSYKIYRCPQSSV